MDNPRKLDLDEIAIAKAVYGNSINYDNVRIYDNAGGAMTLAHRLTGTWTYYICWDSSVHTLGVRKAGVQGTFIHEMAHVWQGNNGITPDHYMVQSFFSQAYHGLWDIWNTGDWFSFVSNWGQHRSATTYAVALSDIGKNWSDFNVEQQGTIVESWWIDEGDRRREGKGFGPNLYGGGASIWDVRFPYIRDVIRARDRNAAFKPLMLPPGGDVANKELQDKLVALAYLPASKADGIIGRTKSATLDALKRFQARNGLKPDRLLGPPGSATRLKLAQHPDTLVAAF